jgi:hypothetical protein
VFTLRSHERIDGLTALERDDHRNRLDLERLGDAGVGVDVDLDEDRLTLRLVDDLVEDRAEGLARAAPRCLSLQEISSACISVMPNSRDGTSPCWI